LTAMSLIPRLKLSKREKLKVERIEE